MSSLTPNRLERAKFLNEQVLELKNEISQRWYRFVQVLYPIYSEHLYQELGFRNWTTYVEATLKLPVTTVGNYLSPYTKLLSAGVDPSLVADVPLSRVSDLAQIARANDGKLDPEILQQARTARTRDESQAFKSVIAKEKERLGIEPIRTINLLVTETLYDLWRESTKLVAQINGEEVAKKHEVELLERSLVEFLRTDEAQEALQSVASNS